MISSGVQYNGNVTTALRQSQRQFSTTIEINQDEVDMEEASSEPKMSRHQKLKLISGRYNGLKPNDVPPKLVDMSMEEIIKLEENLRQRYGFAKAEVKFIMRFKPSVLLNQDNK
jgi:hypothetical protein